MLQKQLLKSVRSAQDSQVVWGLRCGDTSVCVFVGPVMGHLSAAVVQLALPVGAQVLGDGPVGKQLAGRGVAGALLGVHSIGERRHVHGAVLMHLVRPPHPQLHLLVVPPAPGGTPPWTTCRPTQLQATSCQGLQAPGQQGLRAPRRTQADLPLKRSLRMSDSSRLNCLSDLQSSTDTPGVQSVVIFSLQGGLLLLLSRNGSLF